MTGQRLAALYREYGPVIYWRCAKLLRDEVAAEDATQETFLRVCRHLDAAPDTDEALRWIWRITGSPCWSLMARIASRIYAPVTSDGSARWFCCAARIAANMRVLAAS